MSLQPNPTVFTAKWNSLQETVKDVLTIGHFPRKVWDERFFRIYAMCLHHPVPYINQLSDLTKLFLESHALELLTVIQTGGVENTLMNYHTQWLKYHKGVLCLHSLYGYLSNHHIKNPAFWLAKPDHFEQVEVEKLGLDAWAHNVIAPLQRLLLHLLLDQFDKIRHDFSINTCLDIIPDVVNSFVVVQKFKIDFPLKLYITMFEQPFLEHSGFYFIWKAKKLLRDITVSDYVVQVLLILKEESLRSKKYLHNSTSNKVYRRCCQHMVSDHLDLFRGACEEMIYEKRLDDMRNMYLLLREVKDGISILNVIFRKDMSRCENNIIESFEQKKVFVQFIDKMLAVHTLYKSIVVDVFNNDVNFIATFNDTFEEFVNYKLVENQPSKSAEYLSKYCDIFFKKLSKGMCKAAIDHKLSQAITIFDYLEDKDLFLRFYQRHLANRLIQQQSQCLYGEEKMINNLKQATCYVFTVKLHKMFNDVRVSEGLNTQFHTEFFKLENELGITFSTLILQNEAWPLSSSSVSFAIPKQLTPCIQYFEKFYKGKFNDRKLSWLHHLSQGVLKLNYLPKVYIVTMQTFQMAILLLFENQDTFNLSKIDELLQLDHDKCKLYINSLVECKLLLVDGDNISLNMNYTSNRTKIRITFALQEIKQNANLVENHFEIHLKAAIVQIMKAHKLLIYNQLLKEIMAQKYSFVPSISLIKQSIETLVDEGVLECSSNTYSYVT